MTRNLLATILILLTPQVTASTSARINGVTQFLIDRANDNYLYVFENNIKESEHLQCFFGDTYQNLQLASLKELLLSRSLWEESLKADMDTLLTRAVANSVENSLDVSGLAASIWGEYIEFIQQLELEYEGVHYPLSSIPIHADLTLREKINSFYVDSNQINEALTYFQAFKDRSLCQTPVVSHLEFKVHIDALLKIEEQLAAIKAAFQKHQPNIRGRRSEEIGNFIDLQLGKILPHINRVRTSLATLAEFADLYNDEAASTALKVIRTLSEIKRHASIKETEFAEMRRYIMFFAQVSDAESSDQVAALLKAYTLPSVSFLEKRNNRDHWLISAYLGASGSSPKVPSSEDSSDEFAIYAPIGLEYSSALGDGSSLSIMVAPFDFGYPVSLKLSGLTEDIEFDEIVAPSINLNYGLKNYPLAIGLGYQKGRAFESSRANEEKVFIHISFDMPLWVLK